MPRLVPRGRGIYARDAADFAVALQHCQWVALHRSNPDTAARVTAAKEAGLGVWLFSLPEVWKPGHWEAELVTIARETDRVRADGFIADPESGWPDGDTHAEAVRLGVALGRAAQSTSVGVTSYPLWPRVGQLVEGSAGALWGSPQCYLRTTATTALRAGRPNLEALLKGWVDRWRPLGPVVPSVSLWIEPGSTPDDPTSWRTYFDSFPDLIGGIGWPLAGGSAPPSVALDAYKRWSPGIVPPDVQGLLARAERASGMPLAVLASLAGALVLVVGFALYRSVA